MKRSLDFGVVCVAILVSVVSAEAQNVTPNDFLPSNAISQFVRQIFEDSRGHYWFGTNGDGVARFDGRGVEYFSIEQGLGGAAVRGIEEDAAGHVWFATSGGITRFDGDSFVNFTTEQGLPHADAWGLCRTSEGVLWVATYEGAAFLDGDRFVPFELPAAPERDWGRGVAGGRMVRSITQDGDGDLWFAADAGVFRWDGEVVHPVSTEGCGGSINVVRQDRRGVYWWASHYQGICRHGGDSLTNVSDALELQGTEAWSIYEDSAGHLWFTVENVGLYRWDGETFHRYGREDGLRSLAMQCVYEDRKGRLWAGGYLGLCRLEGDWFVEVTQDGPW